MNVKNDISIIQKCRFIKTVKTGGSFFQAQIDPSDVDIVCVLDEGELLKALEFIHAAALSLPIIAININEYKKHHIETFGYHFLFQTTQHSRSFPSGKESVKFN